MNRNLLFWLAIGLTLAFLFNVFQNSKGAQTSKSEALAYSDFMASAKTGAISDVTIQGQELTGHYSSGGARFHALVPNGENIVDRLEGTGVRIKAEAVEG
ncbi:MAG: ATP-dependent metallopeptidase FtsH/Yme1/Tma family protein, partial [Alphaproteobacteria bacterium]|nr:ATP-dependent metallopeptidase FtsH/Yme1/Tma family protein [Alphaproteobacteria bacterium]